MNLKNATKFLQDFALALAAVEAADRMKQYPEDGTITAEDVVDDNNGAFEYIESDGVGVLVDGVVLKQVEAVGGGEGGGETVLRVWAVIEGAIPAKPTRKNGYTSYSDGVVVAHIRLGGYYTSYEGIEFDDKAEFVFPQQVTVTQYFNAKELKKVTA